MKIFFIGLFFCVATYVACGQNDVTLVVSGEGKDKEEATLNALRSAIEQTFGTFVSANTKILDDKIVSDEVVSLSSGNIKRYEYISVENLPNGNTFATLSAEIAINKLVAFAKSKGSECEFAGATFGANVKLYKLYVESSKKVLNNLRLQCIELAPFLYDYELEVGEPQMDGTVEFTVRVLANENTRSFGELIKSTLEALEIDESYANQLTAMGIKSNAVSFFTGKRKKEIDSVGVTHYYVLYDNQQLHWFLDYQGFGREGFSYKDIPIKKQEIKEKYLVSELWGRDELYGFGSSSIYYQNVSYLISLNYNKECSSIANTQNSFLSIMLCLQTKAFNNFIIKDNLDNEYYTPNEFEYLSTARNENKSKRSWWLAYYNLESESFRYSVADKSTIIRIVCDKEHQIIRRYEDRWENRFVLNEVIINTDYKSGEECFEVKFKEKIPIESLSQISKFTVERRSDKF